MQRVPTAGKDGPSGSARTEADKESRALIGGWKRRELHFCSVCLVSACPASVATSAHRNWIFVWRTLLVMSFPYVFFMLSPPGVLLAVEGLPLPKLTDS